MHANKVSQVLRVWFKKKKKKEKLTVIMEFLVDDVLGKVLLKYLPSLPTSTPH